MCGMNQLGYKITSWAGKCNERKLTSPYLDSDEAAACSRKLCHGTWAHLSRDINTARVRKQWPKPERPASWPPALPAARFHGRPGTGTTERARSCSCEPPVRPWLTILQTTKKPRAQEQNWAERITIQSWAHVCLYGSVRLCTAFARSSRCCSLKSG